MGAMSSVPRFREVLKRQFVVTVELEGTGERFTLPRANVELIEG